LVKRVLQRLFSAAVSELGGRIAIVGAIVADLIGGVIQPKAWELAIGLLGGLVAAGAVDIARRSWEFRREPYAVRVAEVGIHLTNGGRSVTYERTVTIRCKLPNFAKMPFMLGWHGEAEVKKVAIRSVGHGFRLDIDPAESKVQQFFVTFDPLRRGQSKTIGWSLDLSEPNLKYDRESQYSVLHMSSIFSRLTFRLTWDKTVPLHRGSVQVREYRTPFDQRPKKLAPLAVTEGNSMKRIQNGVEWNLRGIQTNRTYTLLYPFDGDLAPGSSTA
jgi:hypothetical protein